jgi:streptogramin lyase
MNRMKGPLAAIGAVCAIVAVTAPAGAQQTAAPKRLHARSSINLNRYVVGLGSGAGSLWAALSENGTLLRIDPATGRIRSRIRFATPQTETFADVNDWTTVGDGFVWVTDQVDGMVLRINPASNAIVARIPITSPWDAAVGFGSVWVPQFEPYQVARIDEQTNKVVATIPATGPTAVAVGAGSVWVVEHRAGKLIRIDPATNQVVATIDLHSRAAERILFSNGSVWVSQTLGSPHVFRVDPATNRVVARIVTPFRAGPYTLRAGGGQIWAATGFGIARIDPHTNRVTATFVPAGGRCNTQSYCVADAVYAGDSLWVNDAPNLRIIRVDPR